ncbi:MAG: EpsI family protein [Candidatus Sphingomonas colombiensis]|nr:exosortase-associated protein EpsI, V-type [Sphingomonas sp.]WEK44115.1 MAG: EpsI family protein [Sphingomonas sp.]
MIERREFMFAGACAAALGTAEWLRPRKMRLLLPENEKLTNVIPQHFGGWDAGGGGDIVLPDMADSLAAKLYSERVARSYRRTVQDQQQDVMMLIAYGRSQSDVLQLHRPEKCYPATGFAVTESKLFPLPITQNVSVPAVMLSAEMGSRIEDIVYWTRLGETLPQTYNEQRWARFETALHGYIADGVLVRASMIRMDGVSSLDVLSDFMRDMVLGIKANQRATMIGDTLAQRLV